MYCRIPASFCYNVHNWTNKQPYNPSVWWKLEIRMLILSKYVVNVQCTDCMVHQLVQSLTERDMNILHWVNKENYAGYSAPVRSGELEGRSCSTRLECSVRLRPLIIQLYKISRWEHFYWTNIILVHQISCDSSSLYILGRLIEKVLLLWLIILRTLLEHYTSKQDTYLGKFDFSYKI